MSGAGRAKRALKEATGRLDEQAELERQKRDRESRRAERLMIRAFRSSGGGIFETDPGRSLGAGNTTPVSPSNGIFGGGAQIGGGGFLG